MLAGAPREAVKILINIRLTYCKNTLALHIDSHPLLIKTYKIYFIYQKFPSQNSPTQPNKNDN